jgi:tRNA A-37 threonylcarbamoyl transferase component Bud32
LNRFPSRSQREPGRSNQGPVPADPDARLDEYTASVLGSLPRGILQTPSASRPQDAALPRRPLLAVAAMVLGAGIGSLLTTSIVFPGALPPEAFQLPTQPILDGLGVGLNAAMLLLGHWTRGPEASPRALDLSLLLLGLLLVVEVWRLVFAHGLRRRRGRTLRAGQVGSYRLFEKLGEGGMGEVWRARHALLRRPTAVKMVRRDLVESPKALRRFEHEVRAVSELTDPHTIGIYDFGKTAEGGFYYAMEFLEGVDLQQLVERSGPVEPARAVFLLGQVLSSLAEAHRRGILHRDIKPSNVFLTVRGTHFDFVKVLDFGLLKHLERHPDERAVEPTEDGTVMGSPLYLAPECFSGDGQDGQASDLYAVGALAYFLLAGRPVFEARSPLQALTAHANTPPTPLRQRGAAVSADLDRVVLRALEKSPEKRFQSAEELLAALRRTPEWDGWTSEQAESWWERHLPIATLLASQPILSA